MMRFHSAITGGLAAFLIIPLISQEQALRTLENALTGTTRSIDSLQKIQERIAQDPLAGIDLIIAATEAPMLEEQERDMRLEALRNDVNGLQMHLDSLEFAQNPATSLSDGRVSTTGMTDEVRKALERLDRPSTDSTGRPTSPHGTASVLPEGPGYSADRVAQARMNYRLGRFDDGLAILKDVTNDPTALYWKARCLEKLDRVQEAIAELEKVVRLAPHSHEGKRARTDIEFLSWKKGFKKRLQKDTKSQTESEGGER